MTEKKEYPTDSDLKNIEKWEFDFKKKTIYDFLDLILGSYNTGYGSIILKGRRTLYLTLVTGGWSGNEDIISSIQDNVTFWAMCWQKSERGGLVLLKIDLSLFVDEQPNGRPDIDYDKVDMLLEWVDQTRGW